MILKLGNKIGEGGCSEVFEWEDNKKIIKLAKTNTTLESMRREYHNNLTAWDIGLSVAQPYEFLDLDGRPGIVSERVYGYSLLEHFMKQIVEKTDEAAEFGNVQFKETGVHTTARILNEIHRNTNLHMPLQRDNLKYCIRNADYLTHDEKEKVIEMLDSLPIKEQLCHGDPNPGNILIRDGKAVIIDWMDASIGNPEADLAEYIVMIRYSILPSSLPSHAVAYFDSIRESVIEEFIHEYTKQSDITYDEIEPWIIPIAARKLYADAISDEEKDILVKEIRRSLKNPYTSQPTKKR